MKLEDVTKPTDSLFAQLLRYGVVGGLAFIVDFGGLWFFTEVAGLHYLVSAALSFLLGMATNYMLSIRWVFSQRSVDSAALEFFLFALIGVAGLIANEIIMWGATEKAHVPYLLSKVLATGFVFVWNFGVRKVLLFDGGGTAQKIFAEVRHPSERTYRYLTGGVLLVIGVRLLLSVASGAGQDWDFINFYNAATRTYQGHASELYDLGRASKEGPEQQYVGFPLSAYLLAPLGALPARSALFAFKLICALCMAAGLVLLYRTCARALTDGRDRAALAFWFSLATLFVEPFWFVFVIGGQATCIGFLLLVLFARAYLDDRLWAAAAWLTPAILLKPFLVLAMPILLCGGQFRLLRDLAVCGSAAVALSVLILGVDVHLGWAQIVLQESSARWSSRWWNNAAPLGIVANVWNYLIFDAPQFGTSSAPPTFVKLKAAYQLVLLATFAWLAIATGRSRDVEQRTRPRLLLLGIAFAMSFSVIVWPHYVQFLVVPLALVMAQRPKLPRGGVMLLASLIVLGMHVELATQFVAGIPWTPPHTLPGVVITSLLGGGASVLLQVLLVAYRKPLLFAQPQAS